MGMSPFAYFYWGGAILTLAIGTWLWLKILDIQPVRCCDVFLSFVYNLFPAFAWPLSLPLTIVAYMFVRYPNTNIFRRYTTDRSNDQIDHPGGHALRILKFKLDTSKLVLRNATTYEVEHLQKHKDDPRCAVCLEGIEMRKRDSKLRPLDKDTCVTTCQHMFHYVCIRNWILKDKTCPVCRMYQLIEQLRFFYKGQPVKKQEKTDCKINKMKDKSKDITDQNNKTEYISDKNEVNTHTESSSGEDNTFTNDTSIDNSVDEGTTSKTAPETPSDTDDAITMDSTVGVQMDDTITIESAIVKQIDSKTSDTKNTVKVTCDNTPDCTDHSSIQVVEFKCCETTNNDDVVIRVDLLALEMSGMY